MIRRAVVPDSQFGARLDDACVALFPDLSLSAIRKAIDWGGVRLEGPVVRVASRIVSPGERLTVALLPGVSMKEFGLTPERIIHEDRDWLVVDKPSGVYAQRTPYQLKGTLEFAAAIHFKSQGLDETVRIVQRLDGGTSGVTVLPKNRKAAGHLGQILHDGKAEKVYLAVAGGGSGSSSGDGAEGAAPAADIFTVDAAIARKDRSHFEVNEDGGGREASTAFAVLSRGASAFLVEAKPLTGRTHQIRLHLAHAGHPVAGDEKYGGIPAPRLLLHAWRFSFRGLDGKQFSFAVAPDRTFADFCAHAGIVLPQFLG